MLASQTVLDALKERVDRGELSSELGRTLSEVPSQGLVSADGRWFYAMADGIACLLADEAIELVAKTIR